MCFQKKAEAQPNKGAPSVNRIRKEVATESHQIFKIVIQSGFFQFVKAGLHTQSPERGWYDLRESVETLVTF